MKTISLTLIFLLFFSSCSKKKNLTYKDVDSQTQISENSFLNLQSYVKTIIVDTVQIDDNFVIGFKIENSDKITPLSEEVIRLIYNIDKKLSLQGLRNSTLDAFNFNGKPSVVNFWFTSCEPCIMEMPALENLKKKYSREINFISITYDSKEEVENFRKKHTFTFENFYATKNNIKAFGIGSYPTTLFLDENGILIEILNGVSVIENSNGVFTADEKPFIESIKKIL